MSTPYYEDDLVTMFRCGRGIVENRRCKLRTRHPSGLCHHHRSDEA